MRLKLQVLTAIAIAVLGILMMTSSQILASTSLARRSFPLAEYPGFGTNPIADEARYNREELARQRLIAKCMRTQGFPYVPSPARQIDRATTPEQDYASSQSQNILYAENLDVSERESYYIALYGVADPYDSSLAVGGGCLGSASQTLPGVYAAQSKLNEQLLELEGAVRNDAQVLSAEKQWSECMKQQGYLYANTQGLVSELDRAADLGQMTEALKQRNAEAMGVAKLCDSQVSLTKVVAQVRFSKEQNFVSTHRSLLDQHLQQLRDSERLISQLLDE